MAVMVSQGLHVSLSHVERSPYSFLNARFERAQWALSHVVQGRVTTEQGGLESEAPRGALMIHQPHLSYSERGHGGGVHEWLVFDCLLDSHVELLRLYSLPPVVTLRDPLAFSTRFEMLRCKWIESQTPFRSLGCVGLLIEILEMVLCDWAAAGSPPRPQQLCGQGDRFVELIVWMSAHMDQKMTRDALARRVRMHPNSLDRTFREAHGQSPLQMLRGLRLERAMQLLASTNWTLGAIASRCGFEDDAYLTRAFRKRFGQTPGAYRESVKSTTQGYEVSNLS